MSKSLNSPSENTSGILLKLKQAWRSFSTSRETYTKHSQVSYLKPTKHSFPSQLNYGKSLLSLYIGDPATSVTDSKFIRVSNSIRAI